MRVELDEKRMVGEDWGVGGAWRLRIRALSRGEMKRVKVQKSVKSN